MPTSYVDMLADIAALDRDYKIQEATSFATAMADLALSNTTPWAQHMADVAAAERDRVIAVAAEEAIRAIAEADRDYELAEIPAAETLSGDATAAFASYKTAKAAAAKTHASAEQASLTAVDHPGQRHPDPIPLPDRPAAPNHVENTAPEVSPDDFAEPSPTMNGDSVVADMFTTGPSGDLGANDEGDDHWYGDPEPPWETDDEDPYAGTIDDAPMQGNYLAEERIQPEDPTTALPPDDPRDCGVAESFADQFTITQVEVDPKSGDQKITTYNSLTGRWTISIVPTVGERADDEGDPAPQMPSLSISRELSKFRQEQSAGSRLDLPDVEPRDPSASRAGDIERVVPPNATWAKEDIEKHRRAYVQEIVDQVYGMLSKARKEGVESCADLTDEDLKVVANAVAHAYIRAVYTFLDEHPGAKPKLGHRIYPHNEKWNEFFRRHFPVCADWASAINQYVQTELQGTSIKLRNGKTRRLWNIVASKHVQHGFPNGNQHNFVIVYPYGLDYAGGPLDTAIKNATPANYLMFDPWFTIRPELFNPYEGDHVLPNRSSIGAEPPTRWERFKGALRRFLDACERTPWHPYR